MNNTLNAILYTSPEGKGKNEKDSARALKYNDAMLLTLARRLEKFKDPMIRDPQEEAFSPYPKEQGYSQSPLLGIVRAMSSNPKVAQEWLLPRDPSEHPEPLKSGSAADAINRVKYLVGRCSFLHKGWTEDWAIIADEISQGKGIDAKIVPRSYADTRVAATVSGIMNGLGDNLTPDIIKDHLTDEMKSRSGNVLSRYPAGIDRSTLRGDGNGMLMNDKDHDGAQSVLADKALRNLIAGIGEHSRFNTSIQRHHDSQVENALRNYSSPSRESKIQDAFNNNNRTNGFITGSHSWYGEKLEEDMDKNHENVKKVASTIVNYFSVPGIAADTIYDLAFNPSNEKDAKKRSQNLLNYTRDLSMDRFTLATLRFKNDPLTPKKFRFTENEINELLNDADIEAGLFNENKKLTLSDGALKKKDEQQVNIALTNAASKIRAPSGKSSIAEDVGENFDNNYNYARGIE